MCEGLVAGMETKDVPIEKNPFVEDVAKVVMGNFEHVTCKHIETISHEEEDNDEHEWMHYYKAASGKGKQIFWP